MVLVVYTHYLISKNQLSLKIIKAQQEKGESDKSKIKEFISASNKLISKSKQFVPNLTQAYILRATFYVNQKKHSKALKCFQQAINSGEKYNGRLELSRAYFETGKFLSDPNNKYKELNDHPASYYLEKAKTLFEEMDLQWDLEEYRKFVDQKKANA
jgi:tetratricopeptide (TPR) repeat protein